MTSTTPSKGYDEAWVLQSNSDPTKTYIVSRKSDGSFACGCPAWKFAQKPKPDCKHIESVKEGIGVLECVMCRFKTTSMADMLRHRRICPVRPKAESKPLPYKCALCSYASDNFKSYLSHKTIHRPTPVVTKDRAKEIAFSLQARPDIRNPNPEPDPMERFTIRRKFKLME